jgi:hypothetical protein
MSRSMNGLGIYLAQFMGDKPPYNNVNSLAGWAASLGYRDLQIPAWDPRVLDLDLAAGSKAYCDNYKKPRTGSQGGRVIHRPAHHRDDRGGFRRLRGRLNRCRP